VIYRDLYRLMKFVSANVTDLIWVKDMDDRFLFVNKAMCDKLLRCNHPDDVVGKRYMFLSDQERKDCYEYFFEEISVNSDAIVKERKAPIRFVEEGFVGDKHIVIDVRKFPWLNENGEMAGVVGCGRDITQEKETERALRESEEKYKKITENSLTGVFIHQDKKFVLVNDRFANIHGYLPEELQGMDHLSLIHPDEREAAAQRVSKRLKKESVIERYEVQRLKKDGTTVWCEMMATVIDYRGRPAIMGNVIEITERKKAEEALKLTNEELLEESNQRKILSKRLIDLLEKDRHEIAMELHDHIGQILTSLKINIEVIESLPKSTVAEPGSHIKAAKKQVISAINDIRDISHGLMPSLLVSLGLVPSLDGLFSEIQENTGIQIKFFYRNVLKRFGPEKELAIYRIAQEALNNIVKHARAKNVFVSLVKKGKVLSLSVEDDGIGFKRGEALKISKRKESLGLVIMRERAIQLNGTFAIESQIDKGSHVLAEIPM
jgi:PAS domain S-box-containing protein